MTVYTDVQNIDCITITVCKLVGIQTSNRIERNKVSQFIYTGVSTNRIFSAYQTVGLGFLFRLFKLVQKANEGMSFCSRIERKTSICMENLTKQVYIYI